MKASTPLTISVVADSPDQFSYMITLSTGEKAVLRPLSLTDVSRLAQFLEGLSSETRRLSTFTSYDEKMAQELCDAINKFDKLRFVIELPDHQIIGLLELSFGIPQSDHERYQKYGYSLNDETDCRFGPTLADKYQGKGVGSLVFPYMEKIAVLFGKTRMMLLGGVLADNVRAVHYYEKHGFQPVGTFVNSDGKRCADMVKEL